MKDLEDFGRGLLLKPQRNPYLPSDLLVADPLPGSFMVYLVLNRPVKKGDAAT
jgi:hypothetical protein